MGRPSLYEQLTTIEDQTTYADAVRGFRAAQDEREIDVRTALEYHDTRRRNQMRAEVETAQRVLDAQKSLATQAIAAWQAREEARLDEDLDLFITQPPDLATAGRADRPLSGQSARHRKWTAMLTATLGERRVRAADRLDRETAHASATL